MACNLERNVCMVVGRESKFNLHIFVNLLSNNFIVYVALSVVPKYCTDFTNRGYKGAGLSIK